MTVFHSDAREDVPDFDVPPGMDTAAAGQRSDLYRVLSVRESLNLPPVQFRIDGVLPEKGAGAIIGAPGDGKGVTTISLLDCIGIGEPFRDEIAVKQCAVAYVVAEGWAGIPQRMRAHLDYYEVPADADPPIYLIPAAPKLNLKDDRARLIDTLLSLPLLPKVVAVDTLSRTIDGDENATKDMSAYGDGLHAIAEAVDGFAFTLHHVGWDKTRERGNSALRATVDMMAIVVRDDRIVTVSCTKAKDAVEFPPMRFRLQPHLESVVVVPIDGEEQRTEATPRSLREAPKGVRVVLETLADAFADDGASASLLQRTSGLGERTFYRALKDGRRWGFVTTVKRINQLTLAGRDLLTCQ